MEQKETQTLHINMPSAMYEGLRKKAYEEHTTMSAIVKRYLTEGGMDVESVTQTKAE